MALPAFPTTEATFLSQLNGDIWDASANPYGMDDGGHIPNWPSAMNYMAVIANYGAALGIEVKALADQAALDAAAASAGSGTEASVANIRAAVDEAFYISMRRVIVANVPVVLTDAATIAWDMATGINFTVTLGATGRTLANPTNQVAGKSGLLIINQDGTGSRSIASYGSNLRWIGGEPDWPVAPNAISIVSYYVPAVGTVLLNFGGSSA